MGRSFCWSQVASEALPLLPIDLSDRDLNKATVDQHLGYDAIDTVQYFSGT